MSSKAYFRYKTEGLCRRCGGQPIEGKTRCSKCHQEHLSQGNRHRKARIAAGLCRICWVKNRTTTTMCDDCAAIQRDREKRRYQTWRDACIVAYGGRCKCCGTGNRKYLQLDHVNNDGAEHRKEIANGRKGCLYRWAVRQNFPDRLQLLCANCHQAKTTCGGCTVEDHPLCW